MKEFACGDVVPGCSQRFRDESEDGILRQVAAHAAADHDMADVPAEVVADVRSKIRDVA